ncbi:hypothetical protein ETB97_001189 [Aspergillus alliaceus]|uniref:Kinesin light chain n=1 Tax=Petromyces alliaceus TaxID=209559 RepID=A0A8H6E6X9_PETAA|nr:hypothetical protein ETB97_001189 [Aspergillus burnettii]
MACVNPRNIPQSILPPVKSKIKLIKALVLLSAYSFISDPAKGNPLNLHRLVHRATRNWMRQNQRFADFIGKTAERLNEAFPDNDHSNRKVWRAYLPHALSLSEEKEFKYQHDCYVDLIENIGSCLISDGRYNEAEPVFCDAKEIQQRRQGKTHPSTLTIMGKLASVYIRQGRFKQAETLETQVLESSRQTLGPEHHDTLTTMADLAMINYEQGHYKQAETLMVQVLGAMKIVLGPEHRDTLASMAYLGHIYHSQGRLNQAEELYVQVLESQKRVMGPEHPLTVSCIDNLASVYQSQGRLRQAEKLYVQVIEEKEKILGAEHPSTLSSMSNLSSVFKKYGGAKQLKKAEELEKQTIEIRKQTLGPEHPRSLTSMSNLALTYWQQAKLQQAEKLGKHIIESSKMEAGGRAEGGGAGIPEEIRPGTYQHHNQRGESCVYLESASIFVKKHLGPKHPDTVQARDALLQWEEEVGNFTESSGHDSSAEDSTEDSASRRLG